MSVGANPPYGWGGPEPITCFVYNRTGATLARGDLCSFDMKLGEAETTNLRIGDKAGFLANARTIAALNGVTSGQVCVAMEDIPDNGYGQVMLRGVIQCAVGTTAFASTADVNANQPLYCRASKVFFDIDTIGAAPSVGTVKRGVLLEDTSTFTANDQNELLWCFFDGTGFGCYYAS